MSMAGQSRSAIAAGVGWGANKATAGKTRGIHRPDRDGQGKGDGEMTLTGGPGLPSKPEAPWTKGTI